MQFPYLTFVLIFLVVPTVFLWLWKGNFLKRYTKFFIVIGIFSFLWGFLFDLVGSNIWHIWFYRHTLGISLEGLPIEEYLTLLFFPHQLTAFLLIVRQKIYE